MAEAQRRGKQRPAAGGHEHHVLDVGKLLAPKARVQRQHQQAQQRIPPVGKDPFQKEVEAQVSRHADHEAPQVTHHVNIA